MTSYDAIQWTFALLSLAWVFCLGAVVGSFINVLAYRIPAGKDIVRPPSACPHCGTRLTWRENIPILAWLLLRGKCRFCKSPISGQYPLVEFVTALLFALPYLMWFMDPSLLDAVGISANLWSPEWARNPMWVAVWPYFGAILALVGTLIAITLIDAKTFMIPLSLPVFATVVGLCAHAGMGLWHDLAGVTMLTAPDNRWVIPLPTGSAIGLTVGVTVGLILSNAALHIGLIKHSFHDYESWETQALEEADARADADMGDEPGEDLSIVALLGRTLALTGPCLALMFVGFAVGLQTGHRQMGIALGAGVGLIAGIFLRRAIATPASDEEPIWTHYPHTTREILRELGFLVPAILLGALGFALTTSGGALAHLVETPPLWFHAITGSLFGYIVGGGLIWGLRIVGSLAMGREAMGLGDVHLLAAVGAVIGWIDPSIAFLVAPFMAIVWFILSSVFASVFNRKGTAIPFGPHLAAASILVLYAKPMVESLLSLIMGERVNLP
jgi:prepilin signal peptidase PulO-like enzyme (type II secretory pathway)